MEGRQRQMAWLPVIRKRTKCSPTADQPMETKIMRLLTKAAFAALLLGTTAIAAPAFADDTGCPPGLHRANSEGGQNNNAVRRANSEGGQNNAVRQADSEGGQNNNAVRRANSEGGQNNAVRQADSRAVRTTTRSAAPTPRAVRTKRGPPGRLRGRSEQRGPPRRLRGRSEQRGPPGRLRGRSDNNAVRRANSEGGQNNNAVRRAEAIAPSRTAALAPCK